MTVSSLRKRGTGQRELRTDGFSVEPAGVRHFLIWGDKWNSVTKKSVSHTSGHACPICALCTGEEEEGNSPFLPFPSPSLLPSFSSPPSPTSLSIPLPLLSPFPFSLPKIHTLKIMCVCVSIWKNVLMSPANHRGQKGWQISWSWTHRQLWASHCQWLGQNSGILQEQDTFSTAEPTLQLLPKLTLD